MPSYDLIHPVSDSFPVQILFIILFLCICVSGSFKVTVRNTIWIFSSNLHKILVSTRAGALVNSFFNRKFYINY